MYRLAFIPTKFRIEQKPDPFVIEIDMGVQPWKVRNVTARTVADSRRFPPGSRCRPTGKIDKATSALLDRLREPANAGQCLSSGEAEKVLMEHGVTRVVARGAARVARRRTVANVRPPGS